MSGAGRHLEGFEAPIHRSLGRADPARRRAARRRDRQRHDRRRAGARAPAVDRRPRRSGRSATASPSFAAKRDPDFAPVLVRHLRQKGLSRMLNLARISQPRRPARRSSALGGAGRAGRRPQQGRQLPAHASLSRTRPRERDRSRARRRLRARQQCAQALRLGLGACSSRPSGARRSGYPASDFPDPASWLVDEERRAAFEAAGAAFREPLSSDADSGCRRPTRRRQRRARAGRAQRRRDGPRLARRRSPRFVAETDRALDLFAGFMPEVRRARRRRDADLSPRHDLDRARIRVAVPETPIYLDALLADTPLDRRARADARRPAPAHADRPRLPEHEPARASSTRSTIRISPIAGSTRFIALDKTDATKRADQAAPAMVQQAQVDHRAAARGDVQPAGPAARQRCRQQGGRCRPRAAGARRRPCRVRLSDRRRSPSPTPIARAAEEKVRAVERIVNGLGFTTIRESVNAVEAWLSIAARPRLRQRPPAAGPHAQPRAPDAAVVGLGGAGAQRASRRAAAAASRETSGSTPFRLSTHVGDVGHMLVVGPTGAGKSVLLALMALQFRRYPDAQVYHLRQGLFGARGGAGDGRRASCARHRREDGGEAPRLPAAARGSTMPASGAGPPNGSRALLAHEKVVGHARGQGSGLVGARPASPRRRPRSAR